MSDPHLPLDRIVLVTRPPEIEPQALEGMVCAEAGRIVDREGGIFIQPPADRVGEALVGIVADQLDPSEAFAPSASQ